VTDRAGTIRQLTEDTSGILEATISGGGQVVYAASSSGRILRVDVPSRTVSELIGRTPMLSGFRGGGYRSRGSLAWVGGWNLAETTVSASLPLPYVLGGTRLLIGDTPAALVSTSPTKMLIQVPWELPSAASYSVKVESNTTPFEHVLAGRTIWPIYPNFLSFLSAESVPIAAHQEWDSLVTEQNPAGPGEILHFYMTGLGPTGIQVPTGAAAPLSPLAPVTTPLSCDFSGSPAHIYWAGLAPALVGVYQVDMQVPTGLSGTSVKLSCSMAGKSYFDNLPLRAPTAP
jgi:uncharacterized protein (TIGR03437 family)